MLTLLVVFLAAAVVAVSVFRRVGLGTVLGYLAAGAVVGPSGIGVVRDVEAILHFAELGVVLLLFLIGLELQPSRLWKMRGVVFGAGTAQVVLSGALVAGIALLLGQPLPVAIVIGAALALSSTAFAMQTLAEKNELTREHGQASFGILLFQDVATIPMLALIPLLTTRPDGAQEGGPWQALLVAGVIAGLVVVGRFVLRPVLSFVAQARSHELSTASALLVVGGTALLMEHVGVSMALGAFLAGVLLADSQFRHELEANIEPFKGLLLGLFFMAVGMSANVGVFLERPLVVLGLALGLVLLKGVVLFGIGRAIGLAPRSAVGLGVAISQGGEFAFVLFGVAGTVGLLDGALRDLLVLVVTASMVVTPILFAFRDAAFRQLDTRGAPRAFDAIPDKETRVIIAGFGRFGQIVGRILRTKHIPFTALDANPQHIDFLRRFGNEIYYGDASRPDLLRTAKADEAEVLVLAVDDFEVSMKILEAARHHFPHLRVVARARNRQHAYALLGAKVDAVFRETFESSLSAAQRTLEELGMPSAEAREVARRFGEYDEAQVRAVFHLRDDIDALVASSKEYAAELERIFDVDTNAAE
ncbi:MAG: monovalent cation:proton antiporter-2 (CPA2) family protein [Myxococcales bacterium]|nr:monovalent cation:proton antiporter-2 (CPA2) family protein [Myxococcales bacterium]